MRKGLKILVWLLIGAVGTVGLACVFPRAFPLLPADLGVDAGQAVVVAAEALAELGEEVDAGQLVAILESDDALERLLLGAPAADLSRLRQSPIAERPVCWWVRRRGTPEGQGSPKARVSLTGRLLSVEAELEGRPSVASLDPDSAWERGAAWLAGRGFDVTELDAPEVRRMESGGRVFLELRAADRGSSLGGGVPHGVVLFFDNGRLTGFDQWWQKPGPRLSGPPSATHQLLSALRFALLLVAFLVLAFLFPRKYDAGEIRVRRAAHVALVVLAGGLLWMGHQILLVWLQEEREIVDAFGFLLALLVVLLLAGFAFLAWAVGESLCRDLWKEKLASFEALFQGRWGNATVAWAALRGTMAGIAWPALTLVFCMLLRRWQLWPLVSGILDYRSFSLPGLGFLAEALSLGFLVLILCLLVAVPFAVRRLGPWLGGAAALAVTAMMLSDRLLLVPLAASWPVILLEAGLLLGLLLRYDVMTAALAGTVSALLLQLVPLLAAGDSAQLAGGGLVLGVLALPAALTARWLFSEKVYLYHYDRLQEIPSDVLQRVAEQARLRLELETARRIQTSILPELPPSIGGVEVAYCYEPASEVGGDFYDVLALGDGRLTVALGDVAGHGASSGLVMASIRGGLAVHVAFEPRVEAVFQSLNRMVHRSAGRRLLTTLWYGVLDPVAGILDWASVGHLAYVLRSGGTLETLEPAGYPLGARAEIVPAVRRSRLRAGDTLVLFSDGLVEAVRPSDGEPFGFERLEERLLRHGSDSVSGLRDGALSAVDAFTGGGVPEDDRTLVVLRLP